MSAGRSDPRLVLTMDIIMAGEGGGMIGYHAVGWVWQASPIARPNGSGT